MRMFNWYRESNKVQRRTFWGCFSGWALDSFDNQILAFVLPALMALWHFSKAEAGLIATASMLTAALGGWAAGVLSDRHGRVRVLLWSIVWFTAFSVLAGFTTSYPQLLVVRALQGVGFGAEWAVGAALMAEVIHPRHRGKALGLVQSGFSIGWGLAAVVTGLLLAYLPPDLAWRSAFWFVVIPAVPLLFVRRHIPESEVYKAMRIKANNDEVASWRSAFRADVRSTTLLATLLVMGLQTSGTSVAIWLPTMLTQVRELPASSIAMMILMVSVGGFIGQVSFAYINDHFGRRRSIATFCIFGALVTLCYLYLPMKPWMLAFLGVPLGGAMAGVMAGVGPLLSELFPTEIRATCMGFSYNVGKSIGALSATLVGLCADHLGLVNAIALFCILGHCCSLLALSLLPETLGRDLHDIQGIAT